VERETERVRRERRDREREVKTRGGFDRVLMTVDLPLLTSSSSYA